MKKFWALVLVSAMIFSFVGCTVTIGGNPSTQIHTTSIPTSQTTHALTPAISFNTTRYTATPRDEQLNPEFDEMYSFKDNQYYYYVFYLGSLHNVPLQSLSDVDIFEYSGYDYSLTLKSTTSNTDSISEMMSLAESNCVSDSLKLSANLKLPVNIASVQMGITSTISSSQTLSQTESYTTTASVTQTKAREQQITFNANYPHGYYRFIWLGEIDVFGVLMKEIKSGEYSTDIYNVIVTQICSLDFSNSSRFNDTEIEKLTFNLSQDEIESLPIPKVSIEEFVSEKEKEQGPDLTKTITYNSGYERKKIDASYTYRYDTFDISALSEFMNSDYTLNFEVKVFMKEENAGIQEIYLVNDKDQSVDGNASIEYGGPGKARDEWGWTTLNFSANGTDCTNKMHLEYGAHGENSDDWWRAEVQIIVSIAQ